MYVTRLFTYDTDNNFGADGWIPKGLIGFDAGGGLSVAHDTIEHFNATDTSLEAEMMAFGGMLYIRGDYDFGRYGIAGTLGSDLAEFIAHHQIDRVMPPRTKPLQYHEAELQDVLDAMVKEWPDDIPMPTDAVEYARGWMRIGLRKQWKRFGGAHSYRLCEMFEGIRAEVDRTRKVAEIGDTLRVSFSPRTLDYIVKTNSPDFY